MRRSRRAPTAVPYEPEICDSEDHHRALQDLHDLDWNVAEQLNVGARGGQGSEQDGGDDDANRRIAGKQRDGDAGEAIARRKAADEAMDQPKRMDAPGEASDRSRGDHGREEDWRRLNADRPAESWIEAHEAGSQAAY